MGQAPTGPRLGDGIERRDDEGHHDDDGVDAKN
jgi:hypothetical protein